MTPNTQKHPNTKHRQTPANKTYTLSVFPDAGHRFFCDQCKSYAAAAAARAWTLALEHLRTHLS